MPLTLSQEDIAAIAEATAAKLQLLQPRQVMTLAQAMAYVGKSNPDAFYRWCRAWHVYGCSHGRYAKAKLDLGISRWARGIREHKKCA